MRLIIFNYLLSWIYEMKWIDEVMNQVKWNDWIKTNEMIE